jgi:hypothetical protein
MNPISRRARRTERSSPDEDKKTEVIKMKRTYLFLAIFSIFLLLAAPAVVAQQGTPPYTDPPDPPTDPGQEPDPPDPPTNPGRPDETYVPVPNVSFPSIHTSIVDAFYVQILDPEGHWVADTDNLAALDVTEVMQDQYIGHLDNSDGTFALCALEPDGSTIVCIGLPDFCVDGVCEPSWFYGCEEVEDDVWECNDVTLSLVRYPGLDDYMISTYDLDTDGCPLDADQDGEPDTTEQLLTDFLVANEPWFPQPEWRATDPNTGEINPNLAWDADFVEPSNSWQAEWFYLDPADFPDAPPVVYVDIVDWSDVFEAVPEWEVGTRIPVSLTLYEYTGDITYFDGDTNGSFECAYADDTCTGPCDNPDTMVAYKTSLMAFQGGPSEVFGVSSELETAYFDDGGNCVEGPKYWEEVYFATVVTDKFDAEVCAPDGTCQAFNLVPTIEGDGKVNLKVAGYGYVPWMTGTHRIWVRFNDPLMTIRGAEVNDIANYVLETGCRADDLDWLKALRSGLAIDDTWLDFYVVEAHGDDPPPTPQPPSGGGNGGGNGGNP